MPPLFQNDHAFSMRRISASGSSARNTALPATSTSAPASKSSRAFADEMPPSTSISVSSPMRRFNHQHHLHLRQQPLQHPDIRCRLDRDSGTRSGGMYGLDADITVVRRLIVKGDIPGPRLDKACDVTHRIGYHQMHVERLGRGAAYGLHHGEPERYVGHEHPIHDIYVHPLCRAAVDHAGVTVEMAEIGREHRRGYYASHVCRV